MLSFDKKKVQIVLPIPVHLADAAASRAHLD